MDTNSNLDNIISGVKSVTKEVIDLDDHNKVMFTYELTPAEYVAEVAGYMYRKYVVKSSSLRYVRFATSHYLGCRYIAFATETNGIKTAYTLHY